jgi:hypothetical protein
MTAYANIQTRLKDFDFKGLFTQELMWNHFQTKDLEVKVDGSTYALTPVAQRGMAVYEFVPPTDKDFPKYATRRKIDMQVSKTAREHIIIFHDQAKTVQIWQWVKRETGKPSACREQLFYTGQSGDALIQKIQSIAFSLEEESNVTETVGRVGAAFDVDKVTKRFYELFEKEHDTFLKFVEGIPDEELEKWYVSVMLNRLMFIYFVQKKGLLGDDQHYLKNKLAESKRRGKDEYYRGFLCPLFFEGFAERPELRRPEMNRLLGQVPYLNGGLFLRHQIEEVHGKKIGIPDKAFDNIFNFFEQYDWHLDERPTRTGREINPDVLGYVFEKYINQKEMGAYYSKEDITDYISKNTIIPALFDMARKSCKIAFEGEQAVWRLLQTDTDRFINSPITRGIEKELPKSIAVGVNDVSKRAEWNKSATPEYALANETWRDVVMRRIRCSETRKALSSGEIRSIDDLVTYNLDIRRFAEEVIVNCEGPELLRAFYKAIRSISVLDPACGSGAFLFAALNILERLYDSCLVRMQAFVDDLDRSGQHSPDKFRDFRQTVGEMNDKARHPSPRYFILKSIILNNLYGVDIMEEATEICKLRLFLKLVAQVDTNDKIEPLPDIDFNIRSGNTLVGFATEAQLSRTLGSRLDFDNTVSEVKKRAEIAELAYDRFRDMQVQHIFGSDELSTAKIEVKKGLAQLRGELDAYLSGDFGVRANDKVALRKWEDSHKPFHWFAEFFGLMKEGGFDVVLGNPPYKELRDVTQYLILGLTTTETNNLYAPMVERWLQLCNPSGRVGAIVPVSSISTEGYSSLQQIEFRLPLHVSSFDDRPSRLFDGLEHIRLSIHLLSTRQATPSEIFTSECLRWTSEEREGLFSRIQYQSVTPAYLPASAPKISRKSEASILEKVWSDSQSLALQQSRYGEHIVYYSRKMASFLQVLDFVPKVFDGNGQLRPPSEFKELRFPSRPEAVVAFCVLNSTLFRWFVNVFSDFRHLNKREVEGFRCDLKRAFGEHPAFWTNVAESLSARLQETSEMRRMKFKHDTLKVQCIIPKHAKYIIDDIDTELAEHYGLTTDELDFVINYDVKYRVGAEENEAEPTTASTN